jgi:GTP-binding protein
VLDRIFDLFFELNASEDQMEFRTVYASGMQGVSGLTPKELTPNLNVIFDEILKLPTAPATVDKPLQLLIANIDYSDFKGKLGIGRIVNGVIRTGDEIYYGKPVNFEVAHDEKAAKNILLREASAATGTSTAAGDQPYRKGKISELFVFHNTGKEKVSEAKAGEIVVVAGIKDITIGDTIMDKEQPLPLPPIQIEDPTVRMHFSVNKSPLAGREGKYLQSNAIRERLLKELDRNVAMKVYSTDSSDTFEVCGRGQLHLTVLIESMRREGFELMIGPPTVIKKIVDGEVCEPFELLDITVPNEFSSAVIGILNERRGEMVAFTPLEGTAGFSELKFLLSTRAMIGLRNELLTATKGTIVLDTVFDSYRPLISGMIQTRDRGSLLATEDGVVSSYGILHAQDRGKMFLPVKTEVYKDMIVGVHQRPGDLYLNVCKQKHLTNIRSAGAEELEKISPPLELTLEIAVEYIQEDELVEVTPSKIRMLKNPFLGKNKSK